MRYPAIAIIISTTILAACAIDPGISVQGWQKPRVPVSRVVVWTTSPTVEATLTQFLMSNPKLHVVERARLEALLNEQVTTLRYGDERAILKVGAMAGADTILFANVQSEDFTPTCFYTGPCFRVQVTLRGVNVETGEVILSGLGFASMVLRDPDRMAASLAYYTFARAVCPTGNGYEWHDPDPHRQVRFTDLCQKIGGLS